MKQTCTVRTDALREALALCGLVVKPRSPVPAALAVHIRPGPVGLEVCATDFAASVGVGVAAESSLSLSTPADRFSDAVNAIASETTTLTREGTRLVVTGGERTFRLTAAEASNVVRPVGDAAPIVLDGDALADAIDRVEFAANRSPTADWKNGVHFAPSAAALTLTACDTRKYSSVRLSAVAGDGPSCVVSTAYAAAVAKVVAGGDASLVVNARGVTAAAGDRWISCPAFETGYPNTSVLFAGDSGASAVVDRVRLIDEIQAAAVVLGRTEATVGVLVKFEPGRFTVTGMAGAEDATGGGPADVVGGFGFVANYRFLLECLKHADGKTVKLVDGRNSAGMANVQINPESEHKQLIQPLDPAAVVAVAA